MPGNLTQDNVGKLRHALQDYDSAMERFAKAKVALDEAKDDLERAQRQSTMLLGEIHKLLQDMDCESVHNAGYESRRFTLLRMMAQMKF